jgi:outer membrane immunogenic protein
MVDNTRRQTQIGTIMKKILLATALVALGSVSALAADLPARAMYTKAAAAPTGSWAGLYIGINGGGGVANSEVLDLQDEAFANTKFQSGFGTFGGQLGYNWQAGSFVFGLEGDLNYVSANNTRAVGNLFGNNNATFKMDAFGSVRARAGVAVDRALIYVTGGPAWGHFDSNVSLDDNFSRATDKEWRLGLAAGAGVEYQLTQNVVLRGEYLYLNFVDKQSDVLRVSNGASDCGVTHPCQFNFANSAQLARVGLSYKFQ